MCVYVCVNNMLYVLSEIKPMTSHTGVVPLSQIPCPLFVFGYLTRESVIDLLIKEEKGAFYFGNFLQLPASSFSFAFPSFSCFF